MFFSFDWGEKMSTKNNALVTAAALALGVTLTAGAKPVCEGLLNDWACSGFGIAEVDKYGRVMVIATVDDGTGAKTRVVADSLGNARVYSSADQAVALSKRAKLASGVTVAYVRMDKVSTVGDPILALKSKYKAFKTEAATALKQSNIVTAKVSAAVALGWDTATGTPENAEYLDLVERGASIGEWKAFIDAKVVELAASLTAAGIDPLTVV